MSLFRSVFCVFVRLEKTLARRTAQLLDANTDMLEALGTAIAERDSDTGEHNYRAAYYAVRLGETVGQGRSPACEVNAPAHAHAMQWSILSLR